MDLFLYVFAALFSVINPLGTVPVFVGLTQDDSKAEQSKTSIKTAINIFVILVLSFFAGNYILSFFGISIDSLRIAGGLIIVSSGFALLTGNFKKHKGMHKEKVQADIEERESVSLTPLAIPMLAGPGSISLLIALNEEHPLLLDKGMIIGAVTAVCIVTFLILKSGHFIVKKLGASGINAVSRIIGFIVIAIGIEYITSSVVKLFGIL